MHLQEGSPFTPPSTEVEQAARPGVPRVFKVLLAIYFVLTIAGNVMTGNVMGLVLPVIMAIAARSMLKGSVGASRFLGVLFVIAMAMNALGAWGAFGRHRQFEAVVSAAFAVYLGVLAAYIFFSPALQAHFTVGAKARWAGQ